LTEYLGKVALTLDKVDGTVYTLIETFLIKQIQQVLQAKATALEGWLSVFSSPRLTGVRKRETEKPVILILSPFLRGSTQHHSN
jgi:hypothetical protein